MTALVPIFGKGVSWYRARFSSDRRRVASWDGIYYLHFADFGP